MKLSWQIVQTNIEILSLDSTNDSLSTLHVNIHQIYTWSRKNSLQLDKYIVIFAKTEVISEGCLVIKTINIDRMEMESENVI